MTSKRFEHKYWISWAQYFSLRNLLRRHLPFDKNANPQTGEYLIRSLYFDSHDFRCVQEKNNGLEFRKKYRARCYGLDTPASIKLEIKYRNKNRIWKQSQSISPQEFHGFCASPQEYQDSPFMKELSLDFIQYALRPVTIVQYTREAYVYPASNVRITFDKYLSHSGKAHNLLESHPEISVHEGNRLILEVKYDNFLPLMIHKILSSQIYRSTSISKYILCYEGAFFPSQLPYIQN